MAKLELDRFYGNFGSISSSSRIVIVHASQVIMPKFEWPCLLSLWFVELNESVSCRNIDWDYELNVLLHKSVSFGTNMQWCRELSSSLLCWIFGLYSEYNAIRSINISNILNGIDSIVIKRSLAGTWNSTLSIESNWISHISFSITFIGFYSSHWLF